MKPSVMPVACEVREFTIGKMVNDFRVLDEVREHHEGSSLLLVSVGGGNPLPSLVC